MKVVQIARMVQVMSMRVVASFLCILYFLPFVQGETCSTRYFRVLRRSKLIATPLQSFMADNLMICTMRCTQSDWCHEMNLIEYGELKYCELFEKMDFESSEIVNDEKSVFYSVLVDEDYTDEFVISESSPSFTFAALPIQSFAMSQSNTPAPAVACRKLFQENTSLLDGPYTIFRGTQNEAEVFCDMTGESTGCGGGGWTLVMRIDGNQQTFAYSSSLWTNRKGYHTRAGRTLDNKRETKLSSYHSTSFTQICLGMKYNDKKAWITVDFNGTSLFDLVASSSFHGTNISVSDWKGLIPHPSTALQTKCPVQGINAVRGDTGVRIGIIATKACGSSGDYNSRLGFGAKGWSCGQDGSNRCGNDARCGSIPHSNSVKTVGYILVK